MANRTANATVATAWFQINGGNFRQVIIANPIANAEYTIVIRKKTSSPAAARSLSLVVTGLVEAAAVTPVDGACGAANGTPSLVAPSANLCASGTASAVMSGVSSFTWSCASDTGGSVTCTPTSVANGGNASCTASANPGFTFTAFSGDCVGATCNLTNITANKAVVGTFTPIKTFSGTTTPSTGAASMSFTGGGSTCRVDAGNTAFVAAGATHPTGSFPHGWLQLRLVGCTAGATVRVSITWPSVTGTYYKYGRTPSSAGRNVFYTPTNLTTSGNTVSFDITDGGLGDTDLDADGVITDPSGPLLLAVVPAATSAVPVPTLSELALALLGLLMAAAAFANRRSWMRRTA